GDRPRPCCTSPRCSAEGHAAQKAAGAKAAAARFRRETNAGALVRASGEARDEGRHVSRVKDKENIAGAIIEHEEERNEAVAIQAAHRETSPSNPRGRRERG